MTKVVTGGHFVLHFGSSLVSLLSLGVNLLGHNGNSQDGRMKVLISRLLGLVSPSVLALRLSPSLITIPGGAGWRRSERDGNRRRP